MFRNVRFYSLEGDWPTSEEALSKDLENAGFEPCGPFTERSSGWIPVDADTSDSLARRVNGADLIRLRTYRGIPRTYPGSTEPARETPAESRGA